MALVRDEQVRAEGHGYYRSYGSDANDVLGYIANRIGDDLTDYQDSYGGTEFKVTIIVERT